MTRKCEISICGALLLFFTPAILLAAPTNLLVNPGFETGDFAGWLVGGNSLGSGVAIDGTSIVGVDVPFPPNFVNVRSGSYAGWGLISGYFTSIERLFLSQNIPVLPNTNVDVGFWLGNDSQSAFGFSQDDSHMQIFINGGGLFNEPIVNLGPGSTPLDFSEISAQFNTGAHTSINVMFAINGSGTSRVGASFDDFFFVTEPTPEPSSLCLIFVGATGCLGIYVKRSSRFCLPISGRHLRVC